MIIKKLTLAVLLGSLGTSVQAADDFQVEDIQVKGLQRVALGAALTHIPFNVGDNLNEFRVSQSIKALYKSGHFSDVVVSRDANAVIYRVRERATISAITFDGNKDLKEEQLTESLDGSDIRVGETLDMTVISGLEVGLEDFYHSVGKYNADVKANVTHLPRNRVNIDFVFKEGDAAAIEQINIVGNEKFSDTELLERIELTYDSPWWDFMAQDRYQKQTLQGDMETIKSYYLDRGYLQYKVDSTQVSMTPNKEAVYITLNVTEGEMYTVSEVDFIGDMAGFEKTIRAITPIKTEELYNGALVTYSEELVSKFLGRYGYAYPKVVTIPEIDEENKTVKLVLSVDPGKRVYVNRINFKGNNVTSESVLRREMRQMEGAWLSNNLVEGSKAWLQRLPYMETVEFQTNQLPGEDDLVDIDFEVKEQPSGSFTAGIGYGSTTQLSLNAGIQQNNFLGTGNRLGFSINTSSYSKSANVSYTDPYFTVDGVSLGGNLFYQEFDAGNANLVEYNNKTYGAGITLGFPINEYVRLSFGAGYKNNGITRLESYEQIQKFYELYSDPDDPDGGLNFENFDINAAISRSTLNRGTFPTAGSQQSLSYKMTTPNSDVNYFKINLDTKWYFPLTQDQRWTVLAKFQLGYGNGYGSVEGNDQVLPFWENFRAGGSGTLRGFESNIVGPRAIYRRPTSIPGTPDSVGSNGGCCLGPDHDFIQTSRRSVGGNAIAIAGLELIVPTPFLDEGFSNSVRTSIFIDAGNVWDTEFDLNSYKDLNSIEREKIDDYSDAGRYRASAGLSVQWLSPMGPMIFSFAKTLKEIESDDTEFFSFNIGQTF
ncbi:outer membrane protein assembly factor BamA [Colwellia sp. MB02u-18]|uniref:outer membrane protein assembly factor BamA n=1 Tax=unclassified Colwellia TaxID=196834 RepID=UPI0015F69FF8|nr:MULTISPECIES: outer membrane protein assembly factor BamA [unclassified Colwellia]MBA6225119.1 outer membrane protein assembly factor BamA [Colwellia sp. MB3u-45]MBA6268593.1 outer membrane protein assembly factor BamA [Colwellia sp. MB3u-43]MBA6321024.1 outer membrane protein assembly factor BamA [Colwellia sp. MB02u-19]MBA6325577.1 outer membrane protein assembly factor BamA [Colwellia sp. MB02u-18]MBA6332052.1 outer membrane protein assembly factor BamA [Colwellia sp. MB02u-12]